MSIHHDLSRLGVITVLFNPVKYRTRYESYFKFKEHILRSGVNLLTVECIFKSAPRFGLPQQKFEVTQSNDPNNIQIVAPSVMWMKENLINIAVQRLPNYIEYIAWIDADIEFERLDWPYLTMAALQQYSIVQLFKVAYFTGPGGKRNILRKDYSFGYSIRRNKPIHRLRTDWYAHPGYGWAMHRTTFVAIGGLIDFCIVGSADLHFAYALLDRIEETFPHGLHRDYRLSAKSWGSRLAQVAGGGANVGYVDVNLFHRWHGTRESRSYVNRWSILIDYRFSPLTDLTRNKNSGVLGLKQQQFLERFLSQNSETMRIEQLEQAIVAYFISRDEDTQFVLPQQPMINLPISQPRHRPYRSGQYPIRQSSNINNHRARRRHILGRRRGRSTQENFVGVPVVGGFY